MHAPTFLPYRSLTVPKPAASRRRSLWKRFLAFFIMDGPAWWDMHPDVMRKIEAEKRASRN